MLYLRHRRDRLLGNQKPKRRGDRSDSKGKHGRLGRRAVMAGALLMIVGYVSYVASLRHESMTSSSFWPWLFLGAPAPLSLSEDGSAVIPSAKSWQVSMSTATGEAVELHVQEKILEACDRFLRSGHRDELSFLARYLMQESSFDKVVVSRGKPHQILLQLSAPKAVAMIHADTLRYVSESGNIFGRVHEASNPPLTLFSGVFEGDDSIYSVGPSNKLVVGNKVLGKVRLLLSALNMAVEAGLEVTSVDHHPFRGLSMILASKIHVTLGHPPFEKKMSRLSSLLHQAEDSQKMIQKIELDYKGKAFVKTIPQDLSAM